MDPCIKCTRSKLDTGQGVLGLVAPEDLLSACCLVLPLLLSALVSSCPFPSGLVPVGLQGLSWGSPGPLLDLSWASPGGHFGPPGGPWRSRASPGLPLGRSWPLLGRPGRPLGLLLAALGPLLGISWVCGYVTYPKRVYPKEYFNGEMGFPDRTNSPCVKKTNAKLI